jgi:membrane-associated phospholipid phosphatase
LFSFTAERCFKTTIMVVIRQRLLRNSSYFSALGCFIFCTALFILIVNKIEGFLLLNPMHSALLDNVFISVTMLGDGLFAMGIAVVLFCAGYRRTAFYIIVAYLLSGIAAQLLKHIIYAPRPGVVISTLVYTHFIDGVTGTGWSSFPSGHTGSIFAVATVLALVVSKKYSSIPLLFIAVLVGYSRIYIGQHFLQDVLGGAIPGTLTAAIVVRFAGFPQGLFKQKTTSLFTDNDSYSTGLAAD